MSYLLESETMHLSSSSSTKRGAQVIYMYICLDINVFPIKASVISLMYTSNFLVAAWIRVRQIYVLCSLHLEYHKLNQSCG